MVKTPVTDLISPLITAQEGPTFCANMEMMMLNCLEQYGYNRGTKMCGGYIADLEECRLHNFEVLVMLDSSVRILRASCYLVGINYSPSFQRMRNSIMREERRRQNLAGERKERYEKCPPFI